MPVLRVFRAPLDRLGLPCAMIAADGHAVSGWVTTLIAARLALRRAALGLARNDVGEGHSLFSCIKSA